MDMIAMPRHSTLAELLESYAALRQAQRKLQITESRIDESVRYMATPGHNPRLGRERYLQAHGQYCVALAGLRAVRRLAHRRLGIVSPLEDRPDADGRLTLSYGR